MRKQITALLLSVTLLAASGVTSVLGAAGDLQPVMRPGTYVAEAHGWSRNHPNRVYVTVTQTEITSIDICRRSGDTGLFLDVIREVKVPRILENQSMMVDAVAGATLSSFSVNLAVMDALQQAFVAAGHPPASISMFNRPLARENREITLNTEVLVVGLGGSGMTAALRAAELGLDVLAIESQARVGGSTVLTTETSSINPPRIIEMYNDGELFMDAELLRDEWDAVVDGDAKPELLDMFFEQSGPAFDWLRLDLEIPFGTTAGAGLSAATQHIFIRFHFPTFWDNTPMFNLMTDRFVELGGYYMTETKAHELITNDDGDVIGVIARNRFTGNVYTIHADAVILATGGFLGNDDMMREHYHNRYFPLQGAWAGNVGIMNNDGIMLQEALRIGAATFNIATPLMVHVAAAAGQVTGFGVHRGPSDQVLRPGTGLERRASWSINDLPSALGVCPSSIAVNRFGERFFHEMRLGFDSWIGGPVYYSIWSTERLAEIRDEGFTFRADGISAGFTGHKGPIPRNFPLPEAFEVLQAGIDQGFIFRADTIAELAALIDIDPDVLVATVDTYSAFVDAGYDAEFGKFEQYLVPIGQGPFYAIRMAPMAYSTTGGLDVDAGMRVLDTNGAVIRGLYAIGTDTIGVIHSEREAYSTFGAVANGWALTTGFVVAHTVFEDLR